MNFDETRHDDTRDHDAMLEAFASDLRRSAIPPSTPPGLKARALAAAQREMSVEASHSHSVLERWIGAVFSSRLFWAAWATALILALALRPLNVDVSRAEPSPAMRALEAPALEPPDAWIAAASERPLPTGPLLSDTPPAFPVDLTGPTELN